MQKYFYLSAALALVLTSCASDEIVDQGSQQASDKVEAINFKTGVRALTRADHVDADAAALLNNNFVVEGIKGNGTTQTEVFDHYNVNYTASSANTTESNTDDWEYVGIGKHGLSAASTQTIKYWDYSASQYDFIAFSYGKSNYENAVLTEMKYANLGKTVDATGNTNAVYTITGNAEELSKTYIADLVTVYNRDGVSEFGTTVVTPRFRCLGTKVRIAFYETVPGYSVKNVKFYSEAWDESTATTAAGAANGTLFAANAIFPSATTSGTMSVYYPTVGWDNSGKAASSTKDSDYNQAHIKFAAGTETGQALVKTKTFGELDYKTDKENAEKGDGKFIGRKSSDATYAGTSSNNYYQVVLPLGTKDNLQIRIEYDLFPIDGAEEVIHVRDARAVVPAAYADWKPNYAYTYIFKISDNTNGWTGVDGDGKVVEGLTPITFDAVVVETEDGVQETITTVATPSITTYQLGKVVTDNNEYVAGDIYVSVMNGTTAVTLTDDPANYGVYLVTEGENIVNEAIAQDMLNGIKSNTGITWTPAIYEAVSEVPAVDGNTLAVSAAKFAAASGKTYVFDVVVNGKNYVKVIRVQ